MLLAANFAVAVFLFMGAGFNEREIFEPAILIFVGALLATHGAGPISADKLLLRD